jgi:16S rRNA (guanine966-N2)-methyltransferase
MRIIAGAHKGRTLKAPTWAGLRPTSDQLRETLFNILAPRVHGARVLDVFAGTGAVALEALSRGAELGVCIEQRPAGAGPHRGEPRPRGRGRPVYDRPRRCASRARQSPIPGGPFDIVFLDPPYETEDLDDVVKAAASQRADGGVLVLEHSSRRAPRRLTERARRAPCARGTARCPSTYERHATHRRLPRVVRPDDHGPRGHHRAGRAPVRPRGGGGAINAGQAPLFSFDERVAIIREVFA